MILFRQHGTTSVIKNNQKNILSSIRYMQMNKLKFYSTNVKEDEHYDIVISGGGMVGFAMACSLGQSPRLARRKILLLERAPLKQWSLPESFSNRVCSLSKSTQSLFEKLDVWEEIKSMRAQPVKKMQVWESCSEAMINFDKKETNENIAHIVENDVILEAIKRRVPKNVDIIYELSVDEYHLPDSSENNPKLNLSNGQKISCNLLIGADGANSLVRKQMNVQYLHWNYDQMGIVATLKLSEDCDNYTAWQRFLPTGPVALLPLDKNHSSLVWSTTKENAKVLLEMSEDNFIDALNSAIWADKDSNKTVNDIHRKWLDVLNVICPYGGGVHQLPPSISSLVPNTRASYPLGLGHAVHYVSPRVALIGDAAHRVHPLAGQGVNLGFGDVACLTKIIEDTLLLGRHIGDEGELHKYESIRQKHNTAVMATIDGLYRLYSQTITPLVVLRSLGLSTVDAINPLKHRLINIADG